MFLLFKPFLFLSLIESISYLLKNEYDVVEEEVPNGEVVIHHLSDKIVTILSQPTDHITTTQKQISLKHRQYSQNHDYRYLRQARVEGAELGGCPEKSVTMFFLLNHNFFSKEPFSVVSLSPFY